MTWARPRETLTLTHYQLFLQLEGFTPNSLKTEVGNARLHIRPARYDLSTKPTATLQIRKYLLHVCV